MAFGCISSLTHCYGTTAPDTLVPVFRPNYFPLSYLRRGKKTPNNQVQGEQRETKVVVPIILELRLWFQSKNILLRDCQAEKATASISYPGSEHSQYLFKLASNQHPQQLKSHTQYSSCTFSPRSFLPWKSLSHRACFDKISLFYSRILCTFHSDFQIQSVSISLSCA